MSQTSVIILAGGLGKRMCSPLPKVLHNLLDKPMLVHVLENALTLSPKMIYIVVGKYEAIIRETLEQYMNIYQRQYHFWRLQLAMWVPQQQNLSLLE